MQLSVLAFLGVYATLTNAVITYTIERASNPTAEVDAHAEDAGDMSDDSQKRPHLTIQTDLANEAKDADVSNVEAVQGQTTTSSG